MKVLIDSKYREPGGTLTNYKFILKHPIKNVSQMRLLEAIFPNTIYMISENLGTNTFGFTEDPAGTPDEQTITLSTGNYNGSELASEIQTQLNATMTGNDYSVSYSETTNKLTTTKTTGTWKYDDDIEEAMRRVLGLNASQSNQTTDFEHDNMIDLSHPRYLFLDVFTHHSSNAEIMTSTNSSHSFLILLDDDPYILQKTKSLVDFQQIELNMNNDVTHLEIRIHLCDNTRPEFNNVDHQLFLEFI